MLRVTVLVSGQPVIRVIIIFVIRIRISRRSKIEVKIRRGESPRLLIVNTYTLHI